MPAILTSVTRTVTDAESKVVDAVHDLRRPVVSYVQKGVDLAEQRLPKPRYPAALRRPARFIDSQYEFVAALLGAQYGLVKAVVETASPLARPSGRRPTPEVVRPAAGTPPPPTSPVQAETAEPATQSGASVTPPTNAA